MSTKSKKSVASDNFQAPAVDSGIVPSESNELISIEGGEVKVVDSKLIPLAEQEKEVVTEVPEVDLEVEAKIQDIEAKINGHREELKKLQSELKNLQGNKKRGGESKMDQCIKIYQDRPGLARKEYIKLFMDEVGLTLAGSRTYTQLIKTREAENKLPNQ